VIDCGEASELITAYVDGELQQDDEERLCDHLDQCPECREKLDFERDAKEIVKLQHAPRPSPTKVRKRIVDGVMRASEAPGQARPGSPGHARLKPLMVSLMFILALLCGVALLLRSANPRAEAPTAPKASRAAGAGGLRYEAAPTEIIPKPF